MLLKLNVYKDDTLAEVKRTVEADRLKIPYRVAVTVVEMLDDIDLDNRNQTVHFVAGNIDKVEKIIKATFGITDSEIECIDIIEMKDLAKEIVSWVMDKYSELNGGDDVKNLQVTAVQS